MEGSCKLLEEKNSERKSEGQKQGPAQFSLQLRVGSSRSCAVLIHRKEGIRPRTGQCKSMLKYSIVQIFPFGLQKLLLTTHSKTREAEQFKCRRNKVGQKRAASKSYPKWFFMVRQALFDPARALERVSGSPLHLIQTEGHRAVSTFNGIHPNAPLLQDRFLQSEAAIQFHKSVSAQPFVHLCDTSLSPLLAWELSRVALGFGGMDLEKEPLPCLIKERGCWTAFIVVSLTTF